MRLVTVPFLLLVVVLAFQQVMEAQVLDDIAPYTVIKEAEGYEERAYPSSQWVCHTTTGQGPDSVSNSFWPLFGYITGSNSDNVTIPMAAPVTREVKEDTQAGARTSKMCFYLSKAFQQSPPAPVHEDVHLEKNPVMNVFASRIGGNLTTEQWTSLAKELKTKLESAEPAADLSTYYTVGYDSPSKTTNRRNEVWFIKA